MTDYGHTLTCTGRVTLLGSGELGYEVLLSRVQIEQIIKLLRAEAARLREAPDSEKHAGAWETAVAHRLGLLLGGSDA